MGDKRGVSTVVAAVLLIAITMVGIAVVLLSGASAVDDLNADSDEEISEETMLKVDSVFQQADDEGKTFEISDEVDKDVSINRNATYNLTLDNNAVCSTGPREMSTIRHDGKDTVTAYEAGGVWKMTEAGAVMSSPPDLNYQNGSLSLSFTNVTGNLTSSGQLQASSNVTQEVAEQNEIAADLYANSACSPSGVDNASLKIRNSTFSRAWANWARDNYDDKRVSVSVEGGKPAEPYDNVTIKFKLGDVSDPAFNAKNVTVTPGPGSDYEVTATVTNAGGLSATKAVKFKYDNGTHSDDKDVTLTGGESKQVTFTLTDSHVSAGTLGTPVNVTVEADTKTTTKVQFDTASGASPNAQLTADNITSGTTVGDATVGHVWVENIAPPGTMTKTATVKLNVTGQTNTTWKKTIHPGENVSVNVTDALPISRQGTHKLNFSVGSSSMQHPFVVGTPGHFDIRNLQYTTPSRGDSQTFTAKINNTGEQTLTGYVNATIRNEDTGTVVARTNATETLADSQEVTRSVSHTFSNTGTYSFVVTTPNQTQQSTFYVKSGNAAPNFVINRLEITPSRVKESNQVAINVTVTNNGGSAQQQTVTLHNERTGDDLAAWDVTLNPSQTKTQQYATTVENTTTSASAQFERGTNTIKAKTQNGTLSQILEVEQAGSGVEEGEDSDGSEFLKFTKDARIKIVAGGAELEGNRSYDLNYSDQIEWGNPTTVRTYVENETMTEITPLWTSEYNGNLNHPHAEQRMHLDSVPNPYKRNMNVTAGSKLSVWGTSYGCRRYRDSDYDHYRKVGGGEIKLDAFECIQRGGEWIKISNRDDEQNVIIRKNGEEPPTLGEASPVQLSVSQMLDTVNASVNETGHLQLAEDQYIFMYELSKRDAKPGNAKGGGDPDYNDAVVSLKVVSTERDAVQPATFNITDVDAPARVSSGSGDTSVDVTINNTGEMSGQASIYPTFDGAPQSAVNTGALEPGEETQVTITLPTSSYSPGTYNWQVEVAGSDGDIDDSQIQQLRIGSSSSSPFYQTTRVDGPVTSEIVTGASDADDSNATVAVHVDNTGSSDGNNMDVTLVYEDINTGQSYTETKTASIQAGDDSQLTFEIAALPGRTGKYSYYVATPNTTSANQTIEIGQSNVKPTNINIGTKDYTPGTQIIRRGHISRMNVGVENVGPVTDDREVELKITNGGTTVVNSRKTATVHASASQPIQTGFDVSSLSTGQSYTYTITVYNDTKSSQSGPNVTRSGELFLQKVPDGVSTREDSPVNVDSDIVNVTTP